MTIHGIVHFRCNPYPSYREPYHLGVYDYDFSWLSIFVSEFVFNHKSKYKNGYIPILIIENANSWTE